MLPIMKFFLLISISFFFHLKFHSVSSLENTSANIANSPPRGWNSYDSFIWVISEEEFLQSADIVSKRLKAQGYEYVVVDYLWYRRKVPGASTNSLGFDVIDEWGRMVPDPGRWPSSKDGKGFSEIAKKVHDMGLKFGIHIMKGISFQAVNENTPILDTKKGGPYEEGGRVWHAQDIAIKENPCKWMNQGFMSINTELEAGKAFLRSLHEQYAQWGVDFVKHDCIFGEDLDLGEITYVSGVLKEQDHPILYSLSPGVGATPDMANKVTGLVNMYRVTGDDWDNWKDVLGHFDVARDFADAKLAGASGLQGNSWPDLDMLPMGWLSKPDTNDGPIRQSNLTPDEQRTQMTLWSIAKSPLMFGGDVRKLDQATYDIITNPIVLEINSFSSNNKEFPYNGNLKGAWRFAKPSYSSSLVLTSCHDSKAKGWSMETLDEHIEQICWKGNNKQTPFCVSKTAPHLTEQEKKIQEHNRKLYEQKHHLVATDGAEDCLDAAPKRKRITTELKKDSFSPCRLDKNQLWEFNNNGTLINSQSGLCAIVESVPEQTNPSGIRAWVATGRNGEIYTAYFNLNEERTEISTTISKLARVLPAINLNENSCKAKEVWSGKDLEPIQGTISIMVERHGCALLVFNCN